jgi:polyhydroxyalkanoate synthesis regulator phasin
MNNPVIEAFLFGKALAEVTTEKLEESLTNALSEFGKFDAETREKLREFMEEVKKRAETAKQQNSSSTRITIEDDSDTDLQELLDELRSEIARLKAELNNYRQQRIDN